MIMYLYFNSWNDFSIARVKPATPNMATAVPWGWWAALGVGQWSEQPSSGLLLPAGTQPRPTDRQQYRQACGNPVSDQNIWSPIHLFIFFCQYLPKSCTEHGSHTAVLCARFWKNSLTIMHVMSERDLSLRQDNCIVTGPMGVLHSIYASSNKEVLTTMNSN